MRGRERDIIQFKLRSDRNVSVRKICLPGVGRGPSNRVSSFEEAEDDFEDFAPLDADDLLSICFICSCLFSSVS